MRGALFVVIAGAVALAGFVSPGTAGEKQEATVTRYAFRAILDDRRATVGKLPRALGLPRASVQAAVDHLTERGILVIEPGSGEITGARGLSLTETAHRLVLKEHPLYAFCAVDAVGIPVALGADATVGSSATTAGPRCG